MQMHDLAMDLTIVSRAGFLTSVTESGAGFLKPRLCSPRPLRVDGNGLLVKVKGKNQDQQLEEKSQALKGTPKTSVIPEETSLHHHEMNLEKQIDERYEGRETKEEQ